MAAQPRQAHGLTEHHPRVQPTVYEYRQPLAHLVPGAVGRREVVLGRINLEPERPLYRYGEVVREFTWVLSLLPDMKWGPDFFLERNGQWATEAETPEQAQRVLQRTCEALNRWLESNERLKRGLLAEITQAVSAVGVVEEPLPYGADGVPTPLREDLDGPAPHLEGWEDLDPEYLAKHLRQLHGRVGVPKSHAVAIAQHRRLHDDGGTVSHA